MSGDRALMAELGIDQMKLGDLIGIRDVDHRFGRSYRAGWVSICLCIHGDSVMNGHGPGILTLIAGPAEALDFDIDPSANIARSLGIGSSDMTNPNEGNVRQDGNPGIDAGRRAGLATNVNEIVAVSVAGNIAHPGFPGLPAEPYRLASDGTPFLLPTYGGIVYNVSVGDRAFGWAADCIHPGVSICQQDDNQNRGLNVFACIGNRARVMTGGAAGARGFVTGKSGRFSEQVIVHFPREARALMAVGDQVLVRAEGIGLSLTDYPEVTLKGIAPKLLAALPSREKDGRVAFGVVASIPAHLMGAGLGLTSDGGSIHIQSTDRRVLAELGLDQLRLGDLVALEDTDSRHNHGYLRGARGIGVVASTDGPRAGYGPGIAILMTAPGGQMEHFEAPDANLAALLGLED